MTIGITFLIIGLVLLPLGILYFKQTWEDLREQELSFSRKMVVVIIEVFSLFTLSAGVTTWLITISFIFIVFGLAIIYMAFQGLL